MKIIGIDPGQSGALAVFLHGKVTALLDMPTSARLHGKGQQVDGYTLATWLMEQAAGDDVQVVIEAVSARPGQGTASMFRFGESVDQVLGLADQSDRLDRSYLEKAAFTWMLSNAPPEMKEEAMRRALDLLGARQDGDLIRVPLDKAAEALGMTTEEAAPIMEELEAEALYPGWDRVDGREQ